MGTRVGGMVEGPTSLRSSFEVKSLGSVPWVWMWDRVERREGIEREAALSQSRRPFLSGSL